MLLLLLRGEGEAATVFLCRFATAAAALRRCGRTARRSEQRSGSGLVGFGCLVERRLGGVSRRRRDDGLQWLKRDGSHGQQWLPGRGARCCLPKLNVFLHVPHQIAVELQHALVLLLSRLPGQVLLMEAQFVLPQDRLLFEKSALLVLEVLQKGVGLGWIGR